MAAVVNSSHTPVRLVRCPCRRGRDGRRYLGGGRFVTRSRGRDSRRFVHGSTDGWCINVALVSDHPNAGRLLHGPGPRIVRAAGRWGLSVSGGTGRGGGGSLVPRGFRVVAAGGPALAGSGGRRCGGAGGTCRRFPVHGGFLVQRRRILVPGRAPIVVRVGVVPARGGEGGLRDCGAGRLARGSVAFGCRLDGLPALVVFGGSGCGACGRRCRCGRGRCGSRCRQR